MVLALLDREGAPTFSVPAKRENIAPQSMGVNSLLVATALVPIGAGLRVALGHTAILVNSLYLASAIAQPIGPRRVFLAGIVLAGCSCATYRVDTTFPQGIQERTRAASRACTQHEQRRPQLACELHLGNC